MIDLKVNIDVEKARLALVGDGYTFAEAQNMSDQHVIDTWAGRFRDKIITNYYKGVRIGLYDPIEVTNND